MNAGTPWWVTIIVAVITYGGGLYLKELVQFLRKRVQQSGPERQEEQKIHRAVAEHESSMLAIAKARDELIEDNQRLREERREQDARHAADRAEWARERGEMRRDIEEMETRLRTALVDLGALRARHNLT